MLLVILLGLVVVLSSLLKGWLVDCWGVCVLVLLLIVVLVLCLVSLVLVCSGW